LFFGKLKIHDSPAQALRLSKGAQTAATGKARSALLPYAAISQQMSI
jgi:hypothetical protein